MNKMRLIVVALVLSLVVSVPGVFAQETIVDVAAGNEQFSTLVDLVTQAGLAETLSGEGPYTVFAPTNAAFEALPQFVLDYLGSHPDLLTRVLTYHVIPAEVMAADVMTGDVETVEGDTLNVVADDMGVTVDGVPVTQTDIDASNGVIHVIDAVLIPPIGLPEVDVFSVTGPIVTAGSSTVGPLTTRMANVFGDEGAPSESVPSVAEIGSGAGFERFCDAGETDISNASRAIRQSEIDLCGELTPPRTPIEFRVGTDALAVAVAAENDFVSSLTQEELALVFSDPRDAEGNVTAERTWADINSEWPAEAIEGFIPGTDSGTFDYFVEAIYEGMYEAMEEGEMEIADPYIEADFQTEAGENLAEAIAAAEGEELEALEDQRDSAITRPILTSGNQLSENDNVLVQGIEGSPYAIGFFGFAFLEEGLNAVAVDGVEPNGTTAEDGSYPLARPLFIYSDADIMAEKPQVAEFINFYLSNVNDEIVDVGYFPASERALNFARLQWLAATAGEMM